MTTPDVHEVRSRRLESAVLEMPKQLDVFGGEHEHEPSAAPAEPPAPLFEPAAFAPRVPGTLALEVLEEDPRP